MMVTDFTPWSHVIEKLLIHHAVKHGNPPKLALFKLSSSKHLNCSE